MKLFKKKPQPKYRFLSSTDAAGETHYYTERYSKSVWFLPGDYLYVDSSLSFSYEKAKEIFDKLCSSQVCPVEVVLEVSND